MLHAPLYGISEFLVGARFSVRESVERGVKRPFIGTREQPIDLKVQLGLPETVLGAATRLGQPFCEFDQSVCLSRGASTAGGGRGLHVKSVGLLLLKIQY
jgi:hypothetical protein